MKKIIALFLTTAMLLVVVGCKPSDQPNKNTNSSKIASQEKEPLPSEHAGWDMENLPSPKPVESFDIAVMVEVTDPAILVPQRTYYKGDVFETGYYIYKGSYNGRHYFYGKEKQEGPWYITSCDRNSEDFQIHYDITEAIGYNACLYHGVFYNFMDDNALYAYDLENKEKSFLIHGDATIKAITDGWIICRDRSGYNMAYCIETGELIEYPNAKEVVGVGVDKKMFGIQHKGNSRIFKVFASYDPFTDGLTEIRTGNKDEVYSHPIIDDNGDVWTIIYNNDNESTTLYKVHDAVSADGAYADYIDDIINGWYYYRYTPPGSEEENLARLNLVTGETEYCPNIVLLGAHRVMNFYWGSGIKQDAKVIK